MSQIVLRSKNPLHVDERVVLPATDISKDLLRYDNIDEFCFKILCHVTVHLNAKSSSLYLLRDSNSEKNEFVSKFLNVTAESKFEDVLCDIHNELVLYDISESSEEVCQGNNVGNSHENDDTNDNLVDIVPYELCKPLISQRENKIFGFIKVEANSENGMHRPFSRSDIQSFEHLIFLCALGIENHQNQMCVHALKAKNSIADEMLEHHTSAKRKEIDRLKVQGIPDGEKYNLYNFSFVDTYITDDETVLCAMRIFEDLNAFNLYKIPKVTMLSWLVSVKHCYRPIPYHNWRHGFNVAHIMSLMISNMLNCKTNPGLSKIFDPFELFLLVVASFSHDVDHRGTNNAFLIRSGAPLAMLYNSSTLEYHHFETCMRILRVKSNNIFENLTHEQYDQARTLMKFAILATDLTLYFQRRNDFKALLENEDTDYCKHDNKMLLISMMMTACDLAGNTKPWETYEQTIHSLNAEFFDQGDQEKELFGTDPIPMYDRNKSNDLPNVQIGFLDGVCSLVYEMIIKFCPDFYPLKDGMLANKQKWQERIDSETKPQAAYENLWIQFWEMDPENFVWGIDPNEKPPEVEITRVVFSPKRNKKNNFNKNSDNAKSKKRKQPKNKVSDASKSNKGPGEKSTKSCCVM